MPGTPLSVPATTGRPASTASPQQATRIELPRAKGGRDRRSRARHAVEEARERRRQPIDVGHESPTSGVADDRFRNSFHDWVGSITVPCCLKNAIDAAASGEPGASAQLHVRDAVEARLDDLPARSCPSGRDR